MISLLTAPFYLIPLIRSWRAIPFSPSTIFFTYSTLGSWFLSLLLDLKLFDEKNLIASWIITKEGIPFTGFALANFTIFLLTEIKFKKNKQQYLLRTSKTTKIISAALILTLTEILITLYLYSGLDNWINASYARVKIEDSRINFIFPLMLTVNVVISCAYCVLTSSKTTKTQRILLYTTIALQTFYLIGAGGRSILLLMLVSLAIIKLRKVTTSSAIKILFAFAGIIIASGLMISARYEAQGASAKFENTIENIITASYTGLPFIDHIALSAEYVKRNDLSYFDTYSSIWSFFIPRSIWQEKPIQISRLMRDEFWGDSSGGIPPGFFGEGVIAFGWLGFLITVPLYAAILSFSNHYCTSPQIIHLQRLRTAVMSTLIGFILVRGGLDIGTYRVGLVIAAYIITERVLYKKIRS